MKCTRCSKEMFAEQKLQKTLSDEGHYFCPYCSAKYATIQVGKLSGGAPVFVLDPDPMADKRE